MNREASPLTEVTPAMYAEMFRRKSRPPGRLSGVCGRVIRGTHPEDFARLTFLPGRRLALMTGPNGLQAWIGVTGHDIVLSIGKTEAWLREKLADGMKWKLMVFPQAVCRRADWDGLFFMVREQYPEVADKLLRWVPRLRDPAFASKIAPHLVTSQVKDDEQHLSHMSVSRYLTCEDTPENARLFLWHSLGLNDQFQGTGYTQTQPDDGVEEYLMPSQDLAEFPNVVVIDLDVRAATGTETAVSSQGSPDNAGRR